MLQGLENAERIVHSSIQKWTKGASEEQVFTLQLHHESYSSGSAKPMQTWPFTLGDDVDAIVSDLIAECEQMAEKVGVGRVSFVVGIKEVRGGRRRFSLEHVQEEEDESTFNDDMSGGFLPTPTKEGIISQTQRHQEAIMRLTVGSTQTIIKSQQAMLEQANNRILELTKENWQLMKDLQSVADVRAERDQKLAKEDRAQTRMDHVAQSMTALLPLVAGKMLGPGVMPTAPGHATDLEAIISGFFNSLSPQDLQNIMNAVPVMHQPALLEIAERIMANKEKYLAQQRIQKPAENGSNGATTPAENTSQNGAGGVH